MACTKSVYKAFDEWLDNLRIKRNYSTDIRSLNKHYLSTATGTADFPQLLNDKVSSNSDFCPDAVCGLVFELINHEQQSDSFGLKPKKRI